MSQRVKLPTPRSMGASRFNLQGADMHSTIRPFWPPLTAGIALGLVLLATFLLTGHGLGASGFFARFTAWLGGEIVPTATQTNAYLGPFLKGVTNPLASWITWEIVGVLTGFGARLARGCTS